MGLRLPSPLLRGEVLSGHDSGTISFGSAADWLRTHGASPDARVAIETAIKGNRARFSDRRGSVWRIEIHEPGRQPRPLAKARPPQDRPAYEAVRAVAMTMPGVAFASHAAIKAAADAVEGRRA